MVHKDLRIRGQLDIHVNGRALKLHHDLGDAVCRELSLIADLHVLILSVIRLEIGSNVADDLLEAVAEILKEFAGHNGAKCVLCLLAKVTCLLLELLTKLLSLLLELLTELLCLLL